MLLNFLRTAQINTYLQREQKNRTMYRCRYAAIDENALVSVSDMLSLQGGHLRDQGC